MAAGYGALGGALVLSLMLAGTAGAAADASATSPYAGQETRAIKALSPQGFVSQGTTAEQAAQTLAAEITKSQTLVKAAGVTIE